VYCRKVLGTDKDRTLSRSNTHRTALGEVDDHAGNSLCHPRTPVGMTFTGPASCQDSTSRTSLLATQGMRGLNLSGHPEPQTECPSTTPKRSHMLGVAGDYPDCAGALSTRHIASVPTARPDHDLARSGRAQSCPLSREMMPSGLVLRDREWLGGALSTLGVGPIMAGDEIRVHPCGAELSIQPPISPANETDSGFFDVSEKVR